MKKNPAMTNNQASIYARADLSVSPEIKSILPDVLVEYLWQMALGGNWQQHDQQLFVLESVELCGRKIQDIRHFCDDDIATDKRRIYGVEPICCRLQVQLSPEVCRMALCA